MELHYTLAGLAIAALTVGTVSAQNGTLDESFLGTGIYTDNPTVGDEEVMAIVSLSDGSMVLAGTVSNGTDMDVTLRKLTVDGIIDATFGTSGTTTTAFGDADDIPQAMVVDADGKLLMCGTLFTAGLNNNRMFIARYTAAGDLDLTFGGGDGYAEVNDNGGDSEVGRAISVMSDGRIVMVGSGGAPVNREPYILRYLADGTPDPTFASNGKLILGVGLLADEVPYAVHAAENGTITLAGMAKTSSASDQHDAVVYRLLVDGTPDDGFGTSGYVLIEFVPEAQDRARSIWVDATGVTIGCTTEGGSGMARFENDGALDPTFGAAGSGMVFDGLGTDRIAAFVRQPDGKFLLCGEATTPDGLNWVVARKTAQGLTDGTWPLVNQDLDGEDDRVNAIALQVDGKVLVAGAARSGNDGWAVARYENDFLSSVSDVVIPAMHMTVAPDPIANNGWVLLNGFGTGRWDVSVIDAQGRVVSLVHRGAVSGNVLDLDASKLSSGTYIVRAFGEGRIVQASFVKH